MTRMHRGYVSVYNEAKGYGFCIVHELENENEYTSVFFHISDVAELKGVSERDHVLSGNVEKTSDGWKMTDIEATYSPDAWGKRPAISRGESEETFESTQPKRPPPSLQESDDVVDESLSPHRRSKKTESDDDKEDESERSGYWKGGKYVF